MTIRESSLAKGYYSLLEKKILPLLLARNVTPNILTFCGLVLAMLVPAGFYAAPVIGFLFLLASGICDTLDGMLARAKDSYSTYGAFLDSTTDRVADYFYLLGFWVLCSKANLDPWGSGTLIFTTFLFTILISYTKARAEGLGGHCEAGFMGRAPRVIYLLTMSLVLTLLPGKTAIILWSGLSLLCLLTTITFVQRFLHIRNTL